MPGVVQDTPEQGVKEAAPTVAPRKAAKMNPWQKKKAKQEKDNIAARRRRHQKRESEIEDAEGEDADGEVAHPHSWVHPQLHP